MTNEPRVQHNLRIPNGDGTYCAVDVFLPAPDRLPASTVVTRTMYGRSEHRAEGMGWARNGFVYVVADVRGRYDSDGTFVPYHSERGDGAALVDFASEQPWSDGTVVAYGGSYSAYTAWAMAVERPTAVRAVVSLCPSMELAHTKFDPSGILRLYEHLGWWLQHGDARVSRPAMPGQVLPDIESYLALPVVDLPATTGVNLPTWAEVIGRGADHLDDERISDGELAGLSAASFHVGGWYDLVTETSAMHFDLVGSGVEPRPPRRLMIGPWTHQLFVDPTGQHGPGATVDWGSICVQWLRSVLHCSRSGPDHSSTVASIFHRGADTWIDTESITGSASSILLHANSQGGLRAYPQTEAATTSFRYDPADPYPSIPAHLDRSTVDRTDSVAFTTGPLKTDMHIDGTPEVCLTGTTTASRADWIVRLLHRTTSGKLHQVSFGAVTCGSTAEALWIPLSRTAVQLERGSELILHITGSDFPNLARNLNVGDRYHGSEFQTATQTVRVGTATGSRVRIPTRQEN